MRIETFISETLDDVAAKAFPSNRERYRDFPQFRECLNRVYAIVANKTCVRWEEIFGASLDLVLADVNTPNGLASKLSLLRPVNISSREFAQSFSRFTRDGRRVEPPYKPVLNALVENEIIYRNNHYCKDRFPKAYLLDNKFIYKALDVALTDKKPEYTLNVYNCFLAYYPVKLLHHKLTEAQRLYNSLGEKGGMTLRLPDGWQQMITKTGKFSFDKSGKLTIDNLLDGMKKFESQRPTVKRHGREYNWFTSCSSAFRPYLYVGNKNYRELMDCHSGFFWMFAIYGYKKGRIPLRECRKIIDHCFSGTFYQDISRHEKTKAIKTDFMKVLNMSPAQLEWVESMDYKDGLFIQIEMNLRDEYPMWSSFLEEERNHFKSNIGKENHIHITKIEKYIMDKLKIQLNKEGYHNIIRVHDALYGIDEINSNEINNIIYNIIDNILDNNNILTFSAISLSSMCPPTPHIAYANAG